MSHPEFTPVQLDGPKNVMGYPEISIQELMNYIKGPDFPTGGAIFNKADIKQAYATGKGSIVMRAIAEIVEGKSGFQIVATELPYQVNKAELIMHIAELVKDKKIEGISDIRDESDKEGLRIVIENKKNSNNELILNQLYKNSQLQITFGIINLALVNGEPRVLSLRDMCLEFIVHRKEVITRRTAFDLRKAEERDHILQGLLIALKSIDEIIKLIKNSEDVETARNKLINNYSLTEIQSNAILDMKLSRLAALEQQKILNEHNELLNFIQEMKDILSSKERIKIIIKDELIRIKNEFGDDRRTEIIESSDEILDDESLIEKEQVVITATHSGYFKRQPLDVYKSQNRGGKGIIGLSTREEDFVEDLFVTSTHHFMLFFTNLFNVFVKELSDSFDNSFISLKYKLFFLVSKYAL